MSEVVVTGGRGFLGSRLVEHLLAAGEDITVFDNAPTPAGRNDLPGVRYVTGDIRGTEDLSRAITSRTRIIYHMAAVVGVDRYLSRPLDVIDINLTGTRAVLECAHEAGAKVVVAGTSEVFGRNPAVPWDEESDRVLGSTSTDRWTYSSSKALAEHLTFAFIRQYGLRASILRYFNVYGPGQRPAFVVSRSVHRALRGFAPVVYDNGDQTRCFTFVDDAVAATVEAGTNPSADGESFNIGGSEETRISRVAELVADLTGMSATPLPVDTSTTLGSAYQDLNRRIPSTEKAKALLGWKSSVDLAEGLQRTISWARANPWWLEQEESGVG